MTGVAAVALVEAVRPRGAPAPLIDWDAIRRRAHQRLRDEDRIGPGEAARLAGEYAAMAADLTPPLLALVGQLPGGASFPPFQALDRPAWVDLNLDIVARVVDPVLDANRVPVSALLGLGRSGAEAYVGGLLAYLAGRVLGQYDPHLLGREPLPGEALATGLYLVEPNIASFERKASLPGDELRRWLILHELTHAWQFSAHPWLQQHLNSMLSEVLAIAGPGAPNRLMRAMALSLGLPSQLGVLRRMQATMSMVEGYGNLVMNRVGRELLPSFERLKAAHEERTNRRSPLEILFWKVTGLDLKLQQYSRGERFCQQVVDAHGIEALNRAWESPEHLPTLPELANPEAWYRRVNRPAPT